MSRFGSRHPGTQCKWPRASQEPRRSWEIEDNDEVWEHERERDREGHCETSQLRAGWTAQSEGMKSAPTPRDEPGSGQAMANERSDCDEETESVN